MNKPTLLLATLVLALLVGSATTLRAVQDEELTPLQEAMNGLQSGQRKLRKLLKDPIETAATVEVVHAMEANALTAFGLPPDAPATLSEAERPGWRIGFQRQILKVADSLLVLELAVLQGEGEQARQAYKDLNAVKKAGHDIYQ